jgi:hypothetical protein
MKSSNKTLLGHIYNVSSIKKKGQLDDFLLFECKWHYNCKYIRHRQTYLNRIRQAHENYKTVLRKEFTKGLNNVKNCTNKIHKILIRTKCDFLGLPSKSVHFASFLDMYDTRNNLIGFNSMYSLHEEVGIYKKPCDEVANELDLDIMAWDLDNSVVTVYVDNFYFFKYFLMSKLSKKIPIELIDKIYRYF